MNHQRNDRLSFLLLCVYTIHENYNIDSMGNHIVFIDSPRESVKPILNIVSSPPHNYDVCHDVDDDPPENVIEAFKRIMNKIADIERIIRTHKGQWPVMVGISPNCLAARYATKFDDGIFYDVVLRLMSDFNNIRINYVRVTTEDEEDKKLFDLLQGQAISADDDDATIIEACTGDLSKFEALCFETKHPKLE